MTIPTSSPILLPVAVLVLWSLIMLGWLALTRLPTMKRLRMHPQKFPRTQDLGAALPAEVQWKADNYNHLMEQPTIFYAAALSLAMIGAGSGINLVLAWAYVGLRIVHSLVHATSNKVLVRFNLFLLSTAVLMALAVRLLINLL
ncbi:hypothetical protein ATO7_06020 [Oceanococcus atlanticus]|uniref:MAPEG family protein n=1 Tax=Oceanococcus atlanticus TaxID=1317117 RepID=A0A1Y1SIB2_9GAMM|nr:MAPEG family protein [Oceanococcus atlanticus]ORE89413.1 hypothetical protein ATO7_06020 [Oceanococcus atlanticus]RZO84939.1 MAG: MAPEG family protein [Oceanococcus sp.]